MCREFVQSLVRFHPPESVEKSELEVRATIWCHGGTHGGVYNAPASQERLRTPVGNVAPPHCSQPASYSSILDNWMD